jgi:hypothetical protein
MAAKKNYYKKYPISDTVINSGSIAPVCESVPDCTAAYDRPNVINKMFLEKLDGVIALSRDAETEILAELAALDSYKEMLMDQLSAVRWENVPKCANATRG